MIEKTLAHYDVKEKIGEGGMGEVYRAHDTKLSRDVALKFLPESFAVDAERLSRFDREAKLLAALNHANIASIYGIEQSDSQRFLVLELVEGVDLAERLSEGPIAEDDALQVCLQVAEALEAAHEQGVVHRDLKPANIKVSPDGTVKVLDFGLAKALEIEMASGDLSRSPTLMASSPTVQGVILGTAAYMSPEQARGKIVDRRADIWAFGCVLYEMLTGKTLFRGETVSDTLAAVLKTQPDWDALPSGTPASIRKLLHRCLDKDPRQRLRDIGEARIVIDRVLRGEAVEETRTAVDERGRSPLQRFMWPAVAVIVAALAGALAWIVKPDTADPPLRKFSLAVTSEEGRSPVYPVISPDGSMVIYVLAGGLWVQEFGQLRPREIPTEGDADMLFWSPDGAFIGYLAAGNLWKAPVSGGGSIKICDPRPSFTGGRGASWGEDDRIVFSYGSSGLFAVSAQGGDPVSLLDTNPDAEGDFHEPALLPGGRGVLFVTHRKDGAPDTIELLAEGERSVLFQLDGQRLWHPTYSSTGHIVYRRTGANAGVWALPFSLSRLEVTGDPFLVAETGSFPSTSSDGTLVYLRGGNDEFYQSMWIDRDGVFGDGVGEPVVGLGDQALSPDGTRLATVESVNDEVDIWIHDLRRGTRTRFTFREGAEVNPEWSPDGKEIYYQKASADSLLVRLADGTGSATPTIKGRNPSLSRDGQFVAYHVQGGETQEDLWYASLDGSGEPRSFLVTPARERRPRISPNGRYLAYVSDESGENEVYLTRFPSGEGKWQVSIGGGNHPRWGRSGRTLYFTKNQCDIYEVTIATDPALVLGRPQHLIDCEALNLPRRPFRTYDVADDGERFIVTQSNAPNAETIDVGITVVQNWLAEFAGRGTR
jgi:serine/threonine-protein kinase